MGDQVDTAVLWRCLHLPGSDACRLYRHESNWILDGAAVWLENVITTKLSYHVVCNAAWETRQAVVMGWRDQEVIVLNLARDAENRWSWNGQPVPELTGLIDVDLGFTPATNTIAIRRLDLPVGQGTETTAAWLDTSDWTLKPLVQAYQRQSKTRYLYQSPNHNYEAVLTVDDVGIVLDYPELWTTMVDAQ